MWFHLFLHNSRDYWYSMFWVYILHPIHKVLFSFCYLRSLTPNKHSYENLHLWQLWEGPILKSHFVGFFFSLLEIEPLAFYFKIDKLQGPIHSHRLLKYPVQLSLQTTTNIEDKLKMSQSNCSIAIVTFKVLNWKTILMFCRTCVGWNTWKNWLQGGKCNPAHVYFWLLQDTKPNKGFLCPFLCHGQKFAGVSHSAASRCCTGQPCKAPIHWTLSLHLCALYGKENRENKEAVML